MAKGSVLVIHFGGPPLTIHKGHCGVPAEPEVLTDVLEDITCPDCLGLMAKNEREWSKWDD